MSVELFMYMCILKFSFDDVIGDALVYRELQTYISYNIKMSQESANGLVCMAIKLDCILRLNGKI